MRINNGCYGLGNYYPSHPDINDPDYPDYYNPYKQCSPMTDEQKLLLQQTLAELYDFPIDFLNNNKPSP